MTYFSSLITVTLRDVMIQRSLYLIVQRLYELRQTNVSNVNNIPKVIVNT